MTKLIKSLLLSGTACALAVSVNASEDTHSTMKSSASADHSGALSRIFDNDSDTHGSNTSTHASNTDSHGTNIDSHGADTDRHGVDTDTHGADTYATNTDTHDQAPSSHGNASHWGYKGEGGPDHWGSMKADYHLCSAGKMQSPVDIDKGLAVKASEIAFNYSATGLTIGNNGHTVQVDYGSGSHIIVDGHRFDLLQFHFHTPSEHLITGKTYPMEMHLVHKDANGALAVVGVMFESGSQNIALSEIWRHLPKHARKPAHVAGVVINARDLLPNDRRFHHYKGSLTTPPCSEGVNWFVMDTPIQAGGSQVAKFMKIIGENARPVQSAHNRLFISGQ